MASYSTEPRDVTLSVYASAISNRSVAFENAQIPDIAVLAYYYTVTNDSSSAHGRTRSNMNVAQRRNRIARDLSSIKAECNICPACLRMVINPVPFVQISKCIML